MWCSGPGKPTSVSSFSPVIGFCGLGVGQVSLLELARLGHGSPQKTRKMIRKA